VAGSVDCSVLESIGSDLRLYKWVYVSSMAVRAAPARPRRGFAFQARGQCAHRLGYHGTRAPALFTFLQKRRGRVDPAPRARAKLRLSPRCTRG